MASALAARSVQAQEYSSETRAPPSEGEQPGVNGPRSIVELGEAAETGAAMGAVLDALPSTQVRRSGAPLGPAWVSIRGADPSQVRVIIDGVPVNGARAPALDLSTLPVELFERLTLHRSHVPLQLGAPLPGGVVELQTRASVDRARVFGGTGSFATRRIGGSGQTAVSSGSLLVSAIYEGARNDFPFFDDGGTPLNPDDDSGARRANAHVDRGAVLLRHRAEIGAWRLTGVGIASGDIAGVPGLALDQARATELGRGRGFVALRAESPRARAAPVSLGLLAATSVERARFRDPQDEVGLGVQDLRERSWMTLLGVRPDWAPAEGLLVRGVLDWSAESYRPGPRSEGGSRVRAKRDTLAGGLETEWRPYQGRVAISATARADTSFGREQTPAEASSNEVITSWSPHAGLRLDPWRGRPWSAEAFASVGLAERLPSFLERYGDQGAVAGNPDLDPERRVDADMGLQGRCFSETLDARLSYVFFDREIEALILLVETGLGVALPQNVSRASIRGHELSIDAGWLEHLRIGGNWSYMNAIDRSEDDRALPGRPRQQFSLSLRAAAGIAGVEYRVDGVGAFFVDRIESRPMPPRTEQGVVLSLRPDLRWRPVLSFRVDNLLDVRSEQVRLPDGGIEVPVERAIADFFGHPISGRAFFATLSVEPERRREPGSSSHDTAPPGDLDKGDR